MTYEESTLQKYLVQIRRISEHREKGAEEKIRKIYNDLIKDLQGFVGEYYTKYANEDDVLNFAILQQKGRYARFIEEVEKRINIYTPFAAKEIRNTVEKVYTMCYNGILDGVKKSVTNEDLHNNLKEIKGCTPEVAKRAVQNPVSGLKLNDTLEKNRKEVIYNIRKEITTGLNQGDRYSTMARRITDKVDMSYNKAMRIVRTETHKVREGGIHDASDSVDEILRKNPKYDLRMVKTWRNMGDSKVRPSEKSGGKGKSKGKGKNGIGKAKKTGLLKGVIKAAKKATKGLSTGGVPNHIIMDNQTVLQNEMFDLGDGVKAIAPGHSGVAGHDCNCRCFIVEDLMTEEEFRQATGRGFKDNFENGVDNLGESGIINLDKRSLLQSKIKDGSITLDLNKVMQEKHMFETKEEGRSYFKIKQEELQEIINSKHGTGIIRISKDGQIKETIQCDKEIGVNMINGIEEEITDRFTIHYSKKRTHAVPSRRSDRNE